MFVMSSDHFYDLHMGLEEKGAPFPFGEVFDEDDEVERSGYRTTQQQVEELLIAGQRLKDYRSGIFTFGDGKDDGFMPAVVSDLVDGQRLADSIRARQKVKFDEAEKEGKLKKEAEDAQRKKDAEDAKKFRAAQAEEVKPS